MQMVQQNARNATTHIRKLPGFRTTTANTPYNMYFNDKENATDEIKEIPQKVITQMNNMTQEGTTQEST